MPSKTTPLRDWAAASYDPKTGRAASSLMPNGSSTTIEGEHIAPSAQLDHSSGRGGADSWKEFDRRNTQGGSR
jgi:hypothetical protein